MNPPKPIHLKLVQGTARPDRDTPKNADLEKADASIPPPSSLDVNGKAKWREMLRQYTEAGIIDKADLIGLEQLCMSHQRGRAYRRAEMRSEKERSKFQKLAEFSIEMKDLEKAVIYLDLASKAEGRVNQARANQRREAANTRQYLQDYGATPGSKRRLPAGKVQQNDPLADLIKSSKSKVG